MRDKCLEVVRKHANTTRVFTFGIGSVREKILGKGVIQIGSE